MPWWRTSYRVCEIASMVPASEPGSTAADRETDSILAGTRAGLPYLAIALRMHGLSCVRNFKVRRTTLIRYLGPALPDFSQAWTEEKCGRAGTCRRVLRMC